MSPVRLAYMPLITYPDSAPVGSVEAAIGFASAIASELHVTTFAVKIPRVSTSIGGLLLNIPEMIRGTEENSLTRCRDLQLLAQKSASTRFKVKCATRESEPGSAGDTAASEARYFDVVVLPWSKDTVSVSDLSQTVVFGSGRPSILVPPASRFKRIGHVAIAWDASRVAARAVADLMPLLADDCRITVLTVQDEKPLPGRNIAETLSASLTRRGFVAEAHHFALAGRTVAEALQEAAVGAGAELLAMGGFGHSRVRDFVLGGATKGIFADLRLPVLLSH
jgi:nucleotide-binding universal stress UspA family protein